MSNHAAIPEYLGVDEHLLYTVDDRAIALIGEDTGEAIWSSLRPV